MYPNIYMIFSWNILSVGFTYIYIYIHIYIYIGFLYVQWITISENKWNSTISPSLMLKNAKHFYLMFCWNILSVGVMYIHMYRFFCMFNGLLYRKTNEIQQFHQIWCWKMQNISIWCSAGIFYLLGLCIYICIGFLYVSWFTISNEEWILTFQVVILYGFIAFYLIY